MLCFLFNTLLDTPMTCRWGGGPILKLLSRCNSADQCVPYLKKFNQLVAAEVKMKGAKCPSVSSELFLKGGSDRHVVGGGEVGGVDYVILFMFYVERRQDVIIVAPLHSSTAAVCRK